MWTFIYIEFFGICNSLKVIPNVVYTPSLDTLDEYNCSHVAHGDDIAIGADGKDCYHLIRE